MTRFRSWCAETIDWWAAQKVEWYAAHGTVIYIGIIILVMAAKLNELFQLKLNELGDFLAGAFGPVAFLWLVLGFLQQGRELKLSSGALRLQAEELKASVEQQSAMVDAQRESLRHYESSLQPLLDLKYEGDELIEGEYYDHFSISNLGSYCDGVVVRPYIEGLPSRGIDLAPMYNGQSRTVLLQDFCELNALCRIEVEYKRLSGSAGIQVFDLIRYQGDQGGGITVTKRSL